MLTTSVGSRRPGEIIDVAAGHARNHLIPHGLAIRAHGNETIINQRRDEWLRQDEEQKRLAEVTFERLKDIKLSIEAASGTGGSLFGSISAVTAAKALSDLGIELAKNNIVMNPIKALGEYKIKVKLYGDRIIELDLSVVPLGS